MTDNPSEDIQAMDFETAFNALQENVSKLEGEDLPLEQALALFERGQALAKRCAALLEEAELKVRTLTVDSEEETEA
ncbi:MAG TPA: exodeoxyribonuclease VII small subunit [Brevefilum sp.]|nr:exodeoxyribonuclease VII small subunit [Brevefilum sp.]HOR19730.1 exodeoxyribonuclease VII small subunit [Brevefilum sp.]HPL70097.1 exodeoxyribonuclease VII small subunit [Brevefilum sp.]